MRNSDDAAPLGNKVEVDLVRAIGTGSLAASILNLVVGAGIFALPALVVAAIGTAAPFAYLLCSILVGLVFLCFAEAGSRVTGSGGAYACVEAAFGPLAGFLVSTLLWFGVGVLSCAAISNVIADTLASVWPWTGHPSVRLLLLFLLFGGLAAINVAGVRSASRFVVLNTAVKLVPLLVLIATGLPAIHWDNLAVKTWPPSGELGRNVTAALFRFRRRRTRSDAQRRNPRPVPDRPSRDTVGPRWRFGSLPQRPGSRSGSARDRVGTAQRCSSRSRSRTSPGKRWSVIACARCNTLHLCNAQWQLTGHTQGSLRGS